MYVVVYITWYGQPGKDVVSDRFDSHSHRVTLAAGTYLRYQRTGRSPRFAHDPKDTKSKRTRLKTRTSLSGEASHLVAYT